MAKVIQFKDNEYLICRRIVCKKEKSPAHNYKKYYTWFFVKYLYNNGYDKKKIGKKLGILHLKDITLPKELVGKRVMITVKVLREGQESYGINGMVGDEQGKKD